MLGNYDLGSYGFNRRVYASSLALRRPSKSRRF
jgi:hypothetical protein